MLVIQNPLREFITKAAGRLEAAGSYTPLLDAQLWMAHVCGLDRAALLAGPDRLPTAEQSKRFQEGIDRLAAGEPLPYLTGQAEFYGLSFKVTPDTLIPRPETEHIVDAALELVRTPRFAGQDPAILIADVGTGSGCIAVSLAVHAPNVRLIAIDASPAALEVASENAGRHGVADRILFLEGNLLSPLLPPQADYGVLAKVHLIAANLPYIADREWNGLAAGVREYEPSLALRGGLEGLDLIAELLHQAPAVLTPGGAVLLEIGAAQGPAVVDLAHSAFPEAEVQLQQDYAGLDRLVMIRY